MKNLLILLIGFILSSTAQATLIFSDVSYTENTVSFRTTGDLSGYVLPERQNFFSLGFEGDLFTSGLNPNISWSNGIFENSTVNNSGYAGGFSNWNTDGAWLQFSSGLSNETIALGEITTLTLGADVLNLSSLIGEIVFYWDINSSFTTHTELGRVSVNATATAVPVPGVLFLMLLGFAGIAVSRRNVI